MNVHRLSINRPSSMLAYPFPEALLRTCLLLTLLLLSACETAPTHTPHTEFISGRNADRQPIYTSVAPSHWQKMPPEQDLNDTMKPVCEYCIDNTLRLVVHNFPSSTLSERIPPQAQVLRWQRQSGSGIVMPECHDGFVGLRFETDTVLAWAMQLDPELYLSLTGPVSTDLDRQRRADYTIKVTGPQELLEAHRHDIDTFAQQFRLLNPINTDS